MKKLRRFFFLLMFTGPLVLTGCEADDGSGDTDAGGADMVVDDTGMDDADDTIEPITTRDLVVNLSGMDPHVDQLMEFRVVGDDDELSARGYLDPLAVATTQFYFPSSVPEGAYRLDFTADLNQDGDYDAPPDDHAWSEDLSESGEATVNFDHNVNFTDIGASAAVEFGDFTLSLTNMDPHVDQLMELRVIDVDTTQVVGLYLLQAVEGANFDIVIPGIIKEGHNYQVDFYADLDGSTFYDAPPTDHAWRLTGEGDSTGLSLTFDHNINFTDVEF